MPRRPHPVLGSLLPPVAFTEREAEALDGLQEVLDREVAPRAAEHDRVGRYPTDSVAALKRTGALLAGVPTELGGPGFSHAFSLEAQVRIALADSSLVQLFKIHDELVREILAYAPDDRRATIAGHVLDGEIFGLAAAEAGRKVDDPLTTIAVPDGDGFEVNGTKIYTTGAAEADRIALWTFRPDAATPDNPLLGAQQFLVPRDHPGVDVRRDWDALGQRATDSGTIVFERVRLGAEQRSSERGRAPLPHASIRYQAGFAAALVGIGLAALTDVLPFVRDRSRPWPSGGVDHAADDPYVRRLAGELAADLAAAYSLTLATGPILDEHDRPERWFPRAPYAIPVYAAKSAASRAAVRTANDLYALAGTRAAQRTTGLDRHWRNARTLSLHDPVDWKHAEIGRHLLSGWDPEPGLYQ